jgi:hypothetical protein
VPVAVLVAGLLGGTVAYALLRDDVTKPQTVACYELADLEGRAEVLSVEGAGPVAACAELWRQGVLGPGGSVPPLEECTLASGVPAVLPVTPGRDSCAALGTTPADPSAGDPPAPPSEEVNARVLAVRDVLLPRFLAVPCVEPAAGAAIVREELDRAGLGDWTIRTGDFTAEQPCATLSMRPEAREVVLVPWPARR